jgi:hypothetical protein
MSRHSLIAFSDEFEVIVGWDRPLNSYFGNTGKTGGKGDFLVAPTRLVPIQAICEPSGQF